MSSKLAKSESKVIDNKELAESRLAEIEPAVTDAQKSLKEIKRSHLNELQSMGNPPSGVVLTLEAISVALGLINSDKRPDWNKLRSIVRASDFITRVLSFDGQSLSGRKLDRLESDFFSNPEFNFESIRNSNKVCGLLVKWLYSQVKYAQIVREIDPLRAECDLLELELDKLRKERSELIITTNSLEIEISELTSSYTRLVSEIDSIKKNLDSVSNKSQRAVDIVNSFPSKIISGRTPLSVIKNLLISHSSMLCCSRVLLYLVLEWILIFVRN
ncbi:hypothetical protein GEMRC1_012606 [Eukaryota sp. GEM-RC1]